MNKQSDPQSIIEQKVIALYHVNPENDFVNRLEKELLGEGWRTFQAARSSKTEDRRATRLRLALSGALVIALAAGFLITPQGRAWAQEILHFFTHTENDSWPSPMPTMRWVEQTPSAAAPTLTPWPTMTPPAFFPDCGILPTPRCSFEQIRGKVDFTVKQLGKIPEGFYFIGATGNPDEIDILYAAIDGRGNPIGDITISEEPWTGSPAQTSPIGASAVVEAVHIGGLTGEYVRGAYNGNEPVGKSPFWDPNSDIQTLKWIDGGVLFEMESIGNAFPLDRDAFVALAESLTTGPVAAALTPMPATATPEPTLDFHSYYPLTRAQVGEQAGFQLLEPTKLPEFLSFLGARFDAEYKVAQLFYLLDQNAYGYNTNGLVLSEQLAPDGRDCDLCGFITGDFSKADASYPTKVVAADAIIETVQIGDVQGKYVEGGWAAEDDTGMKWDPDPYVKTIRWQKNGIAFELFYWGMEMDKNDMIAVAESLK